MDLGISGLASGFDWRTLVDKLAEVERAPQTSLLADQSRMLQRNNAYGSVKTQLAVLQNRSDTLKDASLFEARSTTTSDDTVASATASAGAPLGSYLFSFTQLATAAKQLGTLDAGAALSLTNDVSGLVVSAAGFGAAVTAGTFTVNGQQITLATSDTLQEVFDKISAATGGTVTAGYDSVADGITLTSASEIVLGTATDTSNFLQAAQLVNNGTGTVASDGKLGSVRQSAVLGSANFATAISDGGSGAGAFKINGVSISFSATADSLASVLDRINNSAAGVTASYDLVNDRVVLTNKSTGDVGLAFEDVSGNFLAATGLGGGALQHGKNLRYTINGGGTLQSQSNTVTEASSGLAKLSVSALKEGGSATVTVASDTTKVKGAITDLLTEYNKVQSMVSSLTASTTDAKGKVTAGVLADESDATAIASSLRSLANGEVTGLTGLLKRLDDLGIVTNGNNDQIELSNAGKLDAALASRLSDVKALFSDPTTGIAVRLSDYLEKTDGDSSTLESKQATISKQAAAIDSQVSDLERIVQANRQRMIDSFVAMETAQAGINNQLKFLQSTFK